MCLANQIRIKLSKCSFFETDIEYLGYNLGWGTWRPTTKRVQAIMNFEVQSQKDLQRFLGALNFYRRHVRNFTFSSAPLTNLLRKTSKWNWGREEERCFQELKKIASSEVLGVPGNSGELVMVTDASDKGGGSTIFSMADTGPPPNSGRVHHVWGQPRRYLQT